MTEQIQPPAYDPEHSPQEFHDKIILKPIEADYLWNSEDPKSLMTNFA
jgi:hypothetical protein